MTGSGGKPSVIIVGGGYAGNGMAQALDRDYDVTLIEPRDRFVHNVGLLRALVDPDFAARIVFPYDHLLTNGRVIHDRATSVTEGQIVLSSEQRLDADFIILATGSDYAFPAKVDTDTTAAFMDRLADARDALRAARHAVIYGAGPVGIELAGEISTAWPEKRITIVDPGEAIMPGPFDEALRTQLREQLDARGVQLVIGDAAPLPDQAAGTGGDFSVTTDKGTEVAGNIWFKCFGGRPAVDYLSGNLKAALDDKGHIRVAPTLQVAGAETVFAIGDVTDIPETKRAGVGRFHGIVVTQNIADLAAGRAASATYAPAPERMVVPLGTTGGAGFDGSDGGRMFTPEEVVQMKGADLTTDRIAQQFGLGARQGGGR